MSTSITLDRGGTFKKVLPIVVAAALLLAASTALYLSAVRSASATKPSDFGLKEGNTIAAYGSDDPDVYIINDAGYKRLFLNPVIFGFYGHLGGFANVKNVSPTVRDAFITSGLYRNCETNDQKVYGVEVTGEDVGVFHWVNTSGAQAVADDPNFFQKVFCINTNEFNWYPKGSDYTSVTQVPNYSRQQGSTSGTPVPVGPISVSLAADNPAAGTLVKSQASADLAHFLFTGNSAVTNITLARIGVSADTDLSNVYLYDGVKRLTDAASVTSGTITFNDSSGLFTVNGSKVISVRADLSSNSGETVGVKLTSVNGNSVSVSGNLFTVANATLATTVLANSATPSANASLSPSNDVVSWQDNVTIGTRYVWLKSLQVRVIGSIYTSDVQNYRLFVDGSQVGPAVAQSDANGYVVFDMSSSPIKLETGTRTLKILADVIGGSSRNFTVSLRQAPDIFTVDSQYNQPILATVNTGSFPDSAGQQTITSGTLTITKTTDSPSGTVVKGASAVTLGRFEFKANGEKMKVENINAAVTYAPLGVTGADATFTLRNGALFADDGHGGPMVQIGSTQSLCSSGDHSCSGYSATASTSYTQYSLGSSLIVEPGYPRHVEVRADVYDDDGTNDINSTDTLAATIQAGSSNVQRLTSLGYGSYPASATPANTLTVNTGSLSAAKYSGYANQQFVSPSNGVKVGHFTLTQSSSEDINVNTINFDGDNSGGSFTLGDVTDMYIKVYNDTGSLVYQSPSKATVSDSASNSYSVNFLLPKNKTYQVEVWGNIPSSLTANDYMNLEMDASGITTGSSTSSSTSAVDGQTITIKSGTLTVSTGSVAASTLGTGGTTKDAYAFTLQPAYDDFTLEEVYVDLANTTASDTGAVANLSLYENGVMIGSTATVNPSTGSASFTGLNRLVAQSAGTKNYTVKVQLANVGVGNNDTGGDVQVQLDGLKYHSSSGTVTTTTGLTPASYTGNDIIDVAAYPTFTNQALPQTLLAVGDQTLFKTKINSSGSTPIKLYQLNFTVTESAGAKIGTTGDSLATRFKIFEDGVNISSLGTWASTSGTAGFDFSSGGGTGIVRFRFTNERSVDATGHVYELVGNVTATGSTPQSIVSKIANPSSSVTTDDASTVASTLSTTSPSVIWSDASAVSHTTSTDDWMNDYLLQTIGQSESLSM